MVYVRMAKECQMSEDLRSLIKDMGFKFNSDYKEWYLKWDERGAGEGRN